MKECTRCLNTKEPSEFYQEGLDVWCKECRRNSAKRYYENNSVKVLSKKKVTNKRYRQSTAGKRSQYKYQRNKYKTNISYRLNTIIRADLLNRLKIKKSSSTASYLGCTIEELKIHLESLFTEGMTWNNQGRNGWEIDHKRPVSSFNLTSLEEAKICWHYTNLQPLWRIDNLKKSDSYGN